ncbi:MAG: TIGR03435 family protein [Acidobacteriota bacterium]
MGGGPGTPDPGRLSFQFVSLRMVLAKAWGVKSYQISGPAWLDSEHFDMTAKVPPGTTKEQFSVMLQNLVADRFKLTLHREKKDLPAYALLVAKGGPKLQATPENDPGKDADAPPAGPPPGGFGRMPMGKDGFPRMPAGPGRGGMAMMMMPGRAKLVGNGMTIARLAESLEQQLDRAVVDLTELPGKYDISLTFEPEQNRMMSGIGRGGPPPGAEGPSPDVEAPANIFTAVQEQLGLKLEPRKMSADLLVVDHMEKVPSEN